MHQVHRGQHKIKVEAQSCQWRRVVIETALDVGLPEQSGCCLVEPAYFLYLDLDASCPTSTLIGPDVIETLARLPFAWHHIVGRLQPTRSIDYDQGLSTYRRASLPLSYSSCRRQHSRHKFLTLHQRIPPSIGVIRLASHAP